MRMKVISFEVILVVTLYLVTSYYTGMANKVVFWRILHRNPTDKSPRRRDQNVKPPLWQTAARASPFRRSLSLSLSLSAMYVNSILARIIPRQLFQCLQTGVEQIQLQYRVERQVAYTLTPIYVIAHLTRLACK